MEPIIIDGTAFIRGISTSDWLSDGGFSPKTKGHNLSRVKGVLYPQPARVADFTGTPHDRVVAKCFNIDYDASSNVEKGVIVTKTGRIYNVRPNNGLLLAQTSTKTYRMGLTNIRSFKGSYFISSNGDITKLSGAALGTMDETWWTVTKGKGGLPNGPCVLLEVSEDTLYIIGGYRIHTWDGTSAVQDAMSLPTNMFATAACKHSNGRDLVIFCSDNSGLGSYNALSGHYGSRPSKAFIVNTTTLEFTKEINLDDQVEGAKTVAGVTYVTYGNKLGYFTEDGITFLRDLDLNLQTITTNVLENLYWSERLENMDGTLLIPDGNSILAVGDLGAGKTFYYPVTDAEADQIDIPLYLGKSYLCYTTTTGSSTFGIYRLDMRNGDGTGKTWTSNRYTFPVKLWIRRIEIEHDELASGGSFTLGYNNEKGVSNALKTVTYAGVGAQRFTRIQCNVNTSMLQLYLTWNAVPVGIKKITVYYEPGE